MSTNMKTKYICVRHPEKEMVWLPSTWLASTLGTVVGGEAGVHEGQVAEEEVHGDVQAESTLMARRMSRFPRTGGQVHGEEEQEEELLLLGLPGEPQEEELRDSRLVGLSHGAGSLDPKADSSRKNSKA